MVLYNFKVILNFNFYDFSYSRGKIYLSSKIIEIKNISAFLCAERHTKSSLKFDHRKCLSFKMASKMMSKAYKI